MEDIKLETVYIPVCDLKPYANNAKVHTEKQIAHIAKSIEEYGFNDPVDVWENESGEYEIVAGHGAVEAAKKLGLEAVPCNILNHLTDEQRRAYCHIHNQTQRETDFDYEILMEDMAALSGCDWEAFGFEGFNFSPDEFGTTFDLDDNEEPKDKQITLKLTKEQYEIIIAACEAVGEPARKGGNKYGNLICEVCEQWAER